MYFDWVAFRELNPEVLRSLWPTAFAEGTYVWGTRTVSRLNYTVPFALQLRKRTENLSQCSRVQTTLAVLTSPFFRGQPRLPCWAVLHFGYPWVWLQSALGQHDCLPSKMPNFRIQKATDLHTDVLSKMLIARLHKYNVDMKAIQDTRWTRNGVKEKKECTFFWSCSASKHQFGAGFIINKKVRQTGDRFYAS
jgi:hypothetical protein